MDASSRANASSSSASSAGNDLTEALKAADGTVLDGIQGLQQVHQARLAQANRTFIALKAQYGDDDPRVQAAQAAVQAGQATISRVSVLRQQMATPTVQVPQSGWVLQGRVLDSDLKPEARFTVFLVDDQKAFLGQYGFAYTDETGYFELHYGSTTRPQPQAAAPQLFIEVANTDAYPVYLSPTPFQPVTGAASYINIVLPLGGEPIGDPPPEIRKIALPNNPKQKNGTKSGSTKK
jgi:hypothetical protein